MNIYTKDLSLSLSNYTEDFLIQHIKKLLKNTTPPSPYGIGDDCAVLKHPFTFSPIITTDSVIAEKHFSLNDSPLSVGKKLIHRNISDIAAMGGSPSHALLNIIASPNVAFDWFSEFISGIQSSCNHYNIQLIGGDLASSPHPSFFSAHLTLLGEAQTPILRSHSHPYDHIYLTGSLGGTLINKHLSFTPRLQEGLFLAQSPHIHSMIDLSDGLLLDLPKIIPPLCFANLHIESIPISHDAHSTSSHSHNPPLFHALCDGEDYELLFTMSSHINQKTFLAQWNQSFNTPLSCIGQILPTHNNSLIFPNSLPIQFNHNNTPVMLDFPLSTYKHFS